MRNPLESWAKSDSFRLSGQYELYRFNEGEPEIGDNDLSLMMKLRKAGTDHRKFMRMITVYVDITAPLCWWKEFDTYKVGTVANSCSTMHCIHKKEFTLDDFSHEHLMTIDDIGARDTDTDKDPRIYARYDHVSDDGHVRDGSGSIIPDEFYPVNGAEYTFYPIDILKCTIRMLNRCRHCYLKTKDKKYWWQMIQLLPTSYNQKRTVMLNYEVLANIYKSRKDHKLDEWHEFCAWIRELPYSELIIGESSEKSDTSVESQEKHSLPSPSEVNELFNEVMRVDGRVRSYRVFDMGDMKILDFYDGAHKSLYAFDLYRVTLDDALVFIEQAVVKLTRQNLEPGA